MPAKAFISYRPDESEYQARVLYAAFQEVLPRENQFMDEDTAPTDENLRKTLGDPVDECEVLLALIGAGWLDAKDPKTGRRRLENQSDFVRVEVSRALACAIPVVPVLIGGTPMPDADQLPDELKKLVDRPAEFVKVRTVDADVERIIRKFRIGEMLIRSSRHGCGVRPASEGGRVKVLFGAPGSQEERSFLPGGGKADWFKDVAQGPEMVVVPAGSFTMSSPEDEPGRLSREGRQHHVTITKPFSVSRFAVTFDEWDAYVVDAGCGGYKPGDSGWGRGRRPVINVSWDDAQDYISWLSKKTGQPYRLLSEEEWEYVARAGTTTPFWWGESIIAEQANFDSNYVYKGGGSKGEFRGETVPVDCFAANPWGLYNVHGNVWEWCEDVWRDSCPGGPSDGLDWLGDSYASSHVARGGSWLYYPWFLRSASRIKINYGFRVNYLGFRLARALIS